MGNQRDRQFTLPKNIRQMGQFGDTYKIYVEDFVYTYVHRTLHMEKQEHEIAAAVLLGKTCRRNNQEYIFISGAQQVSFSEWGQADETDSMQHFTENDMTVDSFEYYGELDELGRCTVAYASIGKDLMPTEKRGSIGSVKPTGWHTVKYDIVDGKYLYNRCHLIGYQLTAENANKNNLITGTRYLNVDGMLLFENMVADYIKETNNHVLYRVTPIFTGDNLLADGVLMEAESVEDNGEGISYNVFCYNVQPGVKIDYVTGDSSLE